MYVSMWVCEYVDIVCTRCVCVAMYVCVFFCWYFYMASTTTSFRTTSCILHGWRTLSTVSSSSSRQYYCWLTQYHKQAQLFVRPWLIVLHHLRGLEHNVELMLCCCRWCWCWCNQTVPRQLGALPPFPAKKQNERQFPIHWGREVGAGHFGLKDKERWKT